MDNDLKYQLLSGSPIKINKVGEITPFTLKEIGSIGEELYNKSLSILTLDKSRLDEERVVELKNFSNFDILVTNCRSSDEFRIDVEVAFTIFFRELVTFIPEYLIFMLGNVEEKRFIHQENFDEVVKVLKMQNMIDDKPKKKIKYKNERARKLAEKREKGRELVKKAKGETAPTLVDLISTLGVYTQDISTVLNWTLYQLYDQYDKFTKQENYHNNFEMFLVGTDPKKLKLEKHWTSK